MRSYKAPGLASFRLQQDEYMNRSLQFLGSSESAYTSVPGMSAHSSNISKPVNSQHTGDRFHVVNLSDETKLYERIGMSGDKLILLKTGKPVGFRFTRERL